LRFFLFFCGYRGKQIKIQIKNGLPFFFRKKNRRISGEEKKWEKKELSLEKFEIHKGARGENVKFFF